MLVSCILSKMIEFKTKQTYLSIVSITISLFLILPGIAINSQFISIFATTSGISNNSNGTHASYHPQTSSPASTDSKHGRLHHYEAPCHLLPDTKDSQRIQQLHHPNNYTKRSQPTC